MKKALAMVHKNPSFAPLGLSEDFTILLPAFPDRQNLDAETRILVVEPDVALPLTVRGDFVIS